MTAHWPPLTLPFCGKSTTMWTFAVSARIVDSSSVTRLISSKHAKPLQASTTNPAVHQSSIVFVEVCMCYICSMQGPVIQIRTTTVQVMKVNAAKPYNRWCHEIS